MRLLYFARLRESLGMAGEDIPLPDGVTDIQGLMRWLAMRGDVWAQEFSGCRPLRAAINQELVPNAAVIGPDDEIAFFPPVTGG